MSRYPSESLPELLQSGTENCHCFFVCSCRLLTALSAKKRRHFDARTILLTTKADKLFTRLQLVQQAIVSKEGVFGQKSVGIKGCHLTCNRPLSYKLCKIHLDHNLCHDVMSCHVISCHVVWLKRRMGRMGWGVWLKNIKLQKGEGVGQNWTLQMRRCRAIYFVFFFNRMFTKVCAPTGLWPTSILQNQRTVVRVHIAFNPLSAEVSDFIGRSQGRDQLLRG